MDEADKEVANRRIQLRKWMDRYVNQAAFVAAYKLNQGEISGLLKDKSFGSRKARNLEAKVGMPVRYLEETSEPPQNIKKADDITIRQFETGGAMGAGLELRDQPGIIQSWSVNREWLQKNVKSFSAANNLCIVTGFGDSMRPMFNPGDPLIVDTGIKSVEFDAIYFFRVGNEGFIKRLQRIPTIGGTIIRAKSENKKYDAWDISSGMDLEVFGRVLKVWCSEDF